MKSSKSFKPRNVLIPALVPILLGAASVQAGGSDPVCAPTRDVNSVMGQGQVHVPTISCHVETKVMALKGKLDVATIHGNGPRYIEPDTREATVAAGLAKDSTQNVATIHGNGPRYFTPNTVSSAVTAGSSQ